MGFFDLESLFSGFEAGLESGAATGSGIAMLFISVYLGIGAFTSILTLAMYIIQSISFTKMLRAVGYKHPWLAWIPLVNNRAIGDLADHYDNGKPSKHLGKMLLTVAIVEIALAFVTIITALITSAIAVMFPDPWIAMIFIVIMVIEAIVMLALMIPYMVYMYDSTWRIYRIFAPSASVILLLLTIFFGDIRAFILLFISGRAPQNLRVAEESCGECAPQETACSCSGENEQ